MRADCGWDPATRHPLRGSRGERMVTLHRWIFVGDAPVVPILIHRLATKDCGGVAWRFGDPGRDGIVRSLAPKTALQRTSPLPPGCLLFIRFVAGLPLPA